MPHRFRRRRIALDGEEEGVEGNRLCATTLVLSFVLVMLACLVIYTASHHISPHQLPGSEGTSPGAELTEWTRHVAPKAEKPDPVERKATPVTPNAPTSPEIPKPREKAAAKPVDPVSAAAKVSSHMLHFQEPHGEWLRRSRCLTWRRLVRGMRKETACLSVSSISQKRLQAGFPCVLLIVKQEGTRDKFSHSNVGIG